MYELLTQQYEFAKIRGEEIASVKVWIRNFARKEIVFPRTWVILLGTLFALLCGATLVIGRAHWDENQSPEKRFVKEIWDQISSDGFMPFAGTRFWSRNGSKNGSRSRTTQTEDRTR